MSFFDHIKRGGQYIKVAWLLHKVSELFVKSQYREALELSHEGLRICRELNYAYGVNLMAGNLSWIYQHLSDYRQAIKYGRYSLRIAGRVEDRIGMVRAYAYLGTTYHYLGEFRKAFRFHEMSLKLAEEIGDYDGITHALGNLALASQAMGSYVTALNYIQHSLSRLAPDDRKLSRVLYVRGLNTLGSIYRAVAEYELGEECFRAALSEAREVGDLIGASQAQVNLGNSFRLQGKYESAIEAFASSLDLKRRLSDLKGESVVLASLAQCYSNLKRYRESIECSQRSLDIARRIQHAEVEWQVLGNMASAYLELNEYEQARAYIEDAIRLIDPVTENNDAGALYHNLGVVFICSGQYSMAEESLFKAITVSESIRGKLGGAQDVKISIFEEQAGAYRNLQWVLAAQGKHEAALEIAERSRARALAESLEHKLRDQEIVEASFASPGLEQIRRIAAEQKTTCVIYSLVTDASVRLRDEKEFEIFAWVVPQDESERVEFHRTGVLTLGPLGDKLEIRAGLSEEKNREALFHGHQKLISLEEDELRHLHKLLIEPIAEHLPNDENALVTFIPDSRLFLVPFAALIDGSGQLLIKSHTISLSPSVQTLDLAGRQRRRVILANKSGAVVVGNPDMPEVTLQLGQPPVKLAPLKYAEQEALDVAKQLGTEPLTGRAATKAAVIALFTQKRFIHLATHGVFDDLDNSKEPGAVALAPADGDNGLLTASEIARLDLHAELAVLSACNTGWGRVTAEGVIGLSRTFMTAGTPSVIVSLWAVADAPTAFLMTNFYRIYHSMDHCRQHCAKARALRYAMLQTMSKYPRPTDWAGFLLLGDAH